MDPAAEGGWREVPEVVTFHKPYHEYKSRNPLGQGGFGKIYRATLRPRFIDLEVPTEVALKISTSGIPETDKDPPVLDESLGENVLRLYQTTFVEAYGPFPRRKTIAMEYCPGGDLNSGIRHGLDFFYLCEYTEQILQGLHYLHSKGAAHLDMKPANILLTSYSETKYGFLLVKIGDIDSLVPLPPDGYLDPGEAVRLGTAGYVAPELTDSEIVCSGKKVDASKTDIWSLGCIVHEMAFGDGIKRAKVRFEKVLLSTTVLEEAEVDVLAIAESSENAVPVRLLMCPRLKDFMDQCFLPDEMRPSAYELLQHPLFEVLTAARIHPEDYFGSQRCEYCDVGTIELSDFVAAGDDEFATLNAQCSQCEGRLPEQLLACDSPHDEHSRVLLGSEDSHELFGSAESRVQLGSEGLQAQLGSEGPSALLGSERSHALLGSEGSRVLLCSEGSHALFSSNTTEDYGQLNAADISTLAVNAIPAGGKIIEHLRHDWFRDLRIFGTELCQHVRIRIRRIGRSVRSVDLLETSQDVVDYVAQTALELFTLRVEFAEPCCVPSRVMNLVRMTHLKLLFLSITRNCDQYIIRSSTVQCLILCENETNKDVVWQAKFLGSSRLPAVTEVTFRKMRKLVVDVRDFPETAFPKLNELTIPLASHQDQVCHIENNRVKTIHLTGDTQHESLTFSHIRTPAAQCVHLIIDGGFLLENSVFDISRDLRTLYIQVKGKLTVSRDFRLEQAASHLESMEIDVRPFKTHCSATLEQKLDFGTSNVLAHLTQNPHLIRNYHNERETKDAYHTNELYDHDPLSWHEVYLELLRHKLTCDVCVEDEG